MARKKKIVKVSKKEKKEVAPKDVKFIVVNSGGNDFYSYMFLMRGQNVEYFSTMAQVLKYLKDNSSDSIRIFEVSSELKTRKRLELDI